jgi:RNA polymerase sigma-70 factor (ECF subfamily)
MPERPADDRLAWIRGVLDRFEAPLTTYAARLLGDVHRARDVVQESFVRLLREDRGKVEARLSSWLYAVVRNRAFDERRRAAAGERALAAARNGSAKPVPDPAAALETKDAARRAFEALGRLPEQQQEVLCLRLRHGLSYCEIAEVMDTTKGNVAVLAHRGLVTLRDRLREPAARRLAGAREGDDR